MTTRSLTEVYILMRNNAIQSRHIYSEQASMSDRVRLVRSNSHHNVDVETGSQGLELRGDSLMPPMWVDSLEEAQYIMTRLRTKIGELKAMHTKHLQRPTLDDSGSEEQHISRLTNELTKHFNTAHRLVQTIKGQSRQGSQTEQRLTRNVVTALVTTLQEISLSCRLAQSNYLKTLTSREERSNAYFELPNFEELSLDNDDLLPGLRSTAQTDDMFTFGPSCSGTLKNNKNSSAFFEEEEDGDIDEIFQKPAMNQKQLMAYAEENTKLAAQREEEVNKIVRSILDLNDIFKDLGNMVQEQGSVLDRIDYNIEMTQMQVHSGLKQLQKAESYQRKNRKMHCICVLGFTIMFLIILLIVIKS